MEEIAEMNERLRAKRIFYFCFIGILSVVIKEMNMSDKSLLNDSPVHLHSQSPIPLPSIAVLKTMLIGR